MTQADVDFVKDHSISRGIVGKQPESIDFGYTLEHEGNVLGVGGFRLINLTTAWAWLNLTDCAGGHIIVVYRTVKEWMQKFVEEKGIKRLQAYVAPDFSEALSLVEHLGFKWESNMEQFLSDGDASMYVRLT